MTEEESEQARKHQQLGEEAKSEKTTAEKNQDEALGNGGEDTNGKVVHDVKTNDVDDDCLMELGFMFEGNQPTTKERFEWPLKGKMVTVVLHVIDDEVSTDLEVLYVRIVGLRSVPICLRKSLSTAAWSGTIRFLPMAGSKNAIRLLGRERSEHKSAVCDGTRSWMCLGLFDSVAGLATNSAVYCCYGP
jgi:hypothetical protein